MYDKIIKALELIEKPRLILKGEHSKQEWECVVLNDLSFLDEMPDEYKTDELYKNIWNRIDNKLNLLKYIPVEILRDVKNEDLLIDIIQKSFYHYSHYQITNLGFTDFSEELIKKIIDNNPTELFYLHTDYFKNNSENVFIYHLNKILELNKNFDKYKQKDYIYDYEKIYKHIFLEFFNNFSSINDKENLLVILLKNIEKIATYNFIKDIIAWGSYISLREVKTPEFMFFLNNFFVKYPMFFYAFYPLLTKSEFLQLLEKVNFQLLDNNVRENLIKFFFNNLNYNKNGDEYYKIAKKIINIDKFNLKYCKDKEFLEVFFLDSNFVDIFNNFTQNLIIQYKPNLDKFDEYDKFDCFCFLINVYFSKKTNISKINEIIFNNKDFIFKYMSINDLVNYCDLTYNLFDENDIKNKFNSKQKNYYLYLSDLYKLLKLYPTLDENFLLELYIKGYIGIYDLSDFIKRYKKGFNNE